jgi:hypothetical protein
MLTMSDVVRLYKPGSVVACGERAWLVKEDSRVRWLEALNSNTTTLTPADLHKVEAPSHLNYIGMLNSSMVWEFT